MAGEWLTATANTNMFTYEIAPVFILMETVVMTHMREIIGSNWKNGDSILAPGKQLGFAQKLLSNYKMSMHELKYFLNGSIYKKLDYSLLEKRLCNYKVVQNLFLH